MHKKSTTQTNEWKVNKMDNTNTLATPTWRTKEEEEEEEEEEKEQDNYNNDNEKKNDQKL